MSWLQLRLDSTPAGVADIEAALLDAGALSVTLEDRANEPLLEPGVGETPLWQALRVTGLFRADTDMQAVVAQLPMGSATPRVEILEDKDWERAWMEHYQPMRFGEGLWICPSWVSPPEPDAINLLLDPGLAFGTGTHPTTAMCLETLDKLSATTPAIRVIDFGCGSGVLGIAAAKLGAEALLFIDNDPQALVATAENAGRNDIPVDRRQIAAPGDYDRAHWAGRADLVFANILAGPLAALAEELCGLLAPGGHLILAGLLDTQEAELIAHYSPLLELAPCARRDEWVCLLGRRGP